MIWKDFGILVVVVEREHAVFQRVRGTGGGESKQQKRVSELDGANHLSTQEEAP